MTRFLHRRAKRIQEFLCRIENYRYWRDKGMSPRHAWAKADLTL